jgi:hypothetical protein
MNTLLELQYLEQLIKFRLAKYFAPAADNPEPVIPELNQWHAPLANFIWKNHFTREEAMLILIGIAPHIKPDLFDRAIESVLKDSGNFPNLGGVRGKNSRSFLPTGETALFLLGDDDLNTRLNVQGLLFGAEHIFSQKKILWLEELPSGEPAMSGKIIMSQDYIDTFIHGKPAPPHFSTTFPAKRIVETRTWESLVISDDLQKQIDEIVSWLKYNQQLMDSYEMANRIKKGYRALFYGPPGTGKTLTAGLLGNELGKDVYKIDLSMVVSKYIGETEKNLELLFARAEDKGWILFFDEADALFGKRTSVRDAHDKYANQEVSYLLQRIEDYNGLIILATNMKSNIDDAFIRRFNSILKFPFPEASERSAIWKKSFPENVLFAKDIPSLEADAATELVNIPDMVKKYELAGGSIINAVHYASLKAVERLNGEKMDVNGETKKTPLVVYLPDVLQGIRKELTKEGKPFAV